jgi:uncharacterized protein
MPTRSMTLLVDGRSVAPVEVAATFGARTRGLLGRDHLDGALLVLPANSVHTIGMRFPIDVALCTSDLEVIAVRRLGPWRVTRPRRGVRVVVEAEAGCFAEWGVQPGTTLAISG